jgi:hypothetical protein
MSNMNTLIERGWETASKYARQQGMLTGTIMSVLRFSKLDDSAFKTLAEAVIETLDPESEFDFKTHTELIGMAGIRGVELEC